MFDMSKWWSLLNPRVPLPGKLTDYAALAGRYNRALVSKVQMVSGTTANFPGDTNRVAISVGVTFAVATAQQAVFSWVNVSNAAIWSTTIIAKEADVALVTPSPWAYAPFFTDITQQGPIVQGPYQLAAGGNGVLWAVELLINPSLDAGE